MAMGQLWQAGNYDAFMRFVSEGGEQGMQIWLDQFAGGIFSVLSPEEEYDIREAAESSLAPRLCRDGRWTVDYRRLRVVAVKRR
ncbi:hypothetical protein [uncultured Paenibacillus sp.]|uniref:hypothetical protein n=1 Tax=uncultured Paenibacillus sp. TaxID=227322 RepID=UPI0028D173D4|nr:hypothetical protein [uncultured Paenibacillus sp.]